MNTNTRNTRIAFFVAAFAFTSSLSAQAKPATVTGEAAGTVAPTTTTASNTASAPTASAPTATAPVASDKKSAPASNSVIPTEVTVNREVFAYEPSGRRDPYKSLMTTSEIRPLLSDLRLTAIAYDPAGNTSVAILREINTKVQYRVKVGQQVGRLRVSTIKPKAVVFTIEEFGFNRQETLHVSSDTTKARTS